MARPCRFWCDARSVSWLVANRSSTDGQDGGEQAAQQQSTASKYRLIEMSRVVTISDIEAENETPAIPPSVGNG
jgi:hypothetical protein